MSSIVDVAALAKKSNGSAGSLFNTQLSDKDQLVNLTLRVEAERQQKNIELIAPKNYMSRAAREAFSSMMAFTSVEGYPGGRFHAGVANIDILELLAIERAKRMFGASHANVQPHSGTQANQAVYFALLNPGDVVLSMGLLDGGHLSHGLQSNLSGKWFTPIFYGTTEEGLLDYGQIAELAERHRPKLIVVGGSSYPRQINFEKIGEIARSVSAFTLADVSHFSALIVCGLYPHPFPHIDIITTTTNKNLRGPRGGLILTRDEAMARKMDAAVFPGVQGGPLPEMIAAKSVSFGEALTPDFESYARAVLDNARMLASTLQSRGYKIVTDGTDTPLVILDLRHNYLTGDRAQRALENVGLTCNRNLVPQDHEKANVTSGIRLGTSAMSTRGMGVGEARQLGFLIADVLDRLAVPSAECPTTLAQAKEQVEAMASSFPIYSS